MSRRQAWLAGRPVSALLFDYGHTLITYQRPESALLDAYSRVAARLSDAGVAGVPSPQVLLRVVHDRIEADVSAHEQAGRLEEIDLVAAEHRAYAECGLPLSDALLDDITDVVQAAWWQGIVVPPAVRSVLGELRERGLRLGLCSNAPYRPRSLHDQLEHFGLTRLFDSVTFSSEVGWRKPSARCFAVALEALGAAAGETVMVGDRRREDVLGARMLGMTTVRTREHRDDHGPDDADLVIDHLSDLAVLLFEAGGDPSRGSADIIAQPAREPNAHQRGR